MRKTKIFESYEAWDKFAEDHEVESIPTIVIDRNRKSIVCDLFTTCKRPLTAVNRFETAFSEILTETGNACWIEEMKESVNSGILKDAYDECRGQHFAWEVQEVDDNQFYVFLNIQGTYAGFDDPDPVVDTDNTADTDAVITDVVTDPIIAAVTERNNVIKDYLHGFCDEYAAKLKMADDSLTICIVDVNHRTLDYGVMVHCYCMTHDRRFCDCRGTFNSENDLLADFKISSHYPAEKWSIDRKTFDRIADFKRYMSDKFSAGVDIYDPETDLVYTVPFWQTRDY